jgi:hypothetical protein
MFDFILQDFENGYMIARLGNYTVFICPDFEPLCLEQDWP